MGIREKGKLKNSWLINSNSISNNFSKGTNMFLDEGHDRDKKSWNGHIDFMIGKINKFCSSKYLLIYWMFYVKKGREIKWKRLIKLFWYFAPLKASTNESK